MTSARRGQGGFTLTELMTVVAIVGVLVALSVSWSRSPATAGDMARRFADLAQEASRIASSQGPVQPNGTTSGDRTRITAAEIDGRLTFTLFRYMDPPADRWDEVETFAFPRQITGAGFVPAVALFNPATVNTDWSTFQIGCTPSGACTAATLFIDAGRGVGGERQARVSVLPLGTSAFVRDSWTAP